MQAKKRLGIIGGMGPVATSYFFSRLVQLTSAKTDQEYIETFIHNNSQVPDRTEGILHGKESPLPQLKRSVALLNDVGVDYIVFACITAHYFIPELQKSSKAKIIDGIVETARYIKDRLDHVKKVGILASTGTLKVGIFQNKLGYMGIESILLNDKDQQMYFMDPVYQDWGIKAGNTTGQPMEMMLKGADILLEQGSEAIIAGCTEVPLVVRQRDLPVPLIDTIEIIVKAAIDQCLGNVTDHL